MNFCVLNNTNHCDETNNAVNKLKKPFPFILIDQKHTFISHFDLFGLNLNNQNIGF